MQGAIGLAGVALGFFLNQAREVLKDRGAIQNKKMCITEDVLRLRHLAENAAKDVAKSLLELVSCEIPSGHSMPPSFRTPMLDSYFSEIAHTYSAHDRYILKEIGHVTPRLDVLLKDLVAADGLWRFSVVAVELLNATAYCANACDRALGDSPRDNAEALLESMKVDPLAIEAYRRATNNIRDNDGVLGLNKRKAP
ncbi:hypothetical protein LOY24_04510 [Pseudomonas putida]|uniref:hypothetical protein n=1 Tax=Pseudomonas putida TaxID=303 RepID=UPI00215F4D0A|nr:hypothetical protein [Pseudomonas putida]UVL79407.1 hypothetical protein LOY24_04510 [Pseudomonas putida]